MNNEIWIHELFISDDGTVVLSLAVYHICLNETEVFTS